MFNRPHHQAIAEVLSKLDAKLFADAQCYFGGGTAIALAINEFRESVDVDFLCASQDGYRLLRERVAERGIDGLTTEPVALLREIKMDRDGIRTFIDPGLGRDPIKFEIVREARIDLSGSVWGSVPVPMLDRADMYAEKLLANDDRWAVKATMQRDIIDLAMMIDAWGEIPDAALAKAQAAYGKSILQTFEKSTAILLDNPGYLRDVLASMSMDAALSDRIPAILVAEVRRLSPGTTLRAHANVVDSVSPAVAEFLRESGKSIQSLDAEKGAYFGTVLFVDGRSAVQDLGRNTAVVHAVPDWLPLPEQGQSYNVKYQQTVPDWQPKPITKALGKSR